jgi:hypothetical protein
LTGRWRCARERIRSTDALCDRSQTPLSLFRPLKAATL